MRPVLHQPAPGTIHALQVRDGVESGVRDAAPQDVLVGATNNGNGVDLDEAQGTDGFDHALRPAGKRGGKPAPAAKARARASRVPRRSGFPVFHGPAHDPGSAVCAQYDEGTQGVPAARSARLLHVEVHRSRMFALDGPEAVLSALCAQEGQGVRHPPVIGLTGPGEIRQGPQDVVLPAAGEGQVGELGIRDPSAPEPEIEAPREEPLLPAPGKPVKVRLGRESRVSGVFESLEHGDRRGEGGCRGADVVAVPAAVRLAVGLQVGEHAASPFVPDTRVQGQGKDHGADADVRDADGLGHVDPAVRAQESLKEQFDAVLEGRMISWKAQGHEIHEGVMSAHPLGSCKAPRPTSGFWDRGRPGSACPSPPGRYGHAGGRACSQPPREDRGASGTARTRPRTEASRGRMAPVRRGASGPPTARGGRVRRRAADASLQAGGLLGQREELGAAVGSPCRPPCQVQDQVPVGPSQVLRASQDHAVGGHRSGEAKVR